MTTPEWLKTGTYGAIGGALLVTIIGFTWGGWMTAGHAETMAATRSHNAVMTAMVPVCLDQSNRDPGKIEKLAVIKAATTYKRDDAVMEAGWATMPGSDKPDRDIAKACLGVLAVDTP